MKFKDTVFLLAIIFCNNCVTAIEKYQRYSIPKSLINERLKVSSRIFGLGLLSGIIISPKYANAAQGAFEMDAGFYLKDILGIGNDKNPTISGQLDSMNSPILHSTTRQIYSKFANSMLNIVQRNTILIADKLKTLKNPNNNYNIVVEYAQQNINYFSTLFRKRGIIINEDSITDRNYFDILLLLYYLKASELIVESRDRVFLRQNIGENILELLCNEYNLEQPTQLIIRSPNDSKISSDDLKILSDNISVLANGIEKILTIFKNNGILLNCIYDPIEISDTIYAYQSFSDSLPVSFQLTLVEPATLLGFFYQAAANTFFHPEIVATTIAAYARKLGYRIRFEDYLMDNYYNSNPIGIQAQDIILEFGILS